MNKEEILHRMHSGKLYYSNDVDLVKEQLTYLDKLFEYNNLKPSLQPEKQKILKEILASFGENSYIETPFYANWGGKNVHIGDNVYINYNVTFVDDTDIFVENNVLIAPNVVISSGTHPIHTKIRKKGGQYNLPIRICENVWIGASAVIMPGVTIGKNSVIGAGSVVTKDIPENVIAIGNPCKVLREINEHDKKYFNKNQPIDIT